MDVKLTLHFPVHHLPNNDILDVAITRHITVKKPPKIRMQDVVNPSMRYACARKLTTPHALCIGISHAVD
jgi:hypothetical protein